MMELSLEPVKMEVKEEPTLTPCLDSGLDTVSQLMTHPTQDPLKVEVKEEPCDDHTYSTIAPSPQLTPGVASTSNSSESSLLLSEGTSIKDEDILIKEDFVEDEDLTATTTTFIPKPKSNEYECPDHGRADVSLEEFTGHLQVHTAASQPLMQVPGAQKAGTTSVMSSPHQEEADPGIKRTSSEVEVIPVGACAGRETLWLPAITEHFLELVIANFKKIQDKVTKKKYIWKAIALELNSKFQISLTADQCHNKWRNLLKSYKKFADNTKATGAAPMSKPPYYDKLHGIIHDSHAVNPKNTISSGVSEIPFPSPFIMATKKRKVDAEGRVFNEEWGVKYFFVETKDKKASCVICSESVAVLKEYNLRRHYETKHLSTYSKFSGNLRSEKYESMKRGLETHLFTRKFAENEFVTRTSYKIVHKMAERGKPFTDGNFIKECMMEAANDLCPEKADLFESISLSASSVVRRTEELGENIVLQIREKARNLLWYSLALDESTDLSSTSQLLVFIRGVNLDFQIMEELASVCSMHGATTGKDIFMEVQKTLQDYNLQWNQLRGVTVDGGKNMAGVRKDLVGQIRTQLEDLQIPGPLFIHCIIHQQALCGKDLDISCVLKPVVFAVNFIRGHALNHRQFQAFLEEIYSDFCDLPYHTAVRWLSCGKVLFRFYKLRNEIDVFLTEKDRADPQLSDPTWLSKLSFLVDITSHMNELNLKLQGKDNLVCDLYRIIKGFRRKLSLFEAQLEKENFSHFHCFKEFCATIAEDVNLDFPKKIIRDLKEHFLKRFSDLDRIESDILLFQNPFDCNLDDVPVELQLELIDLQANDLLKEKHREGKLVAFYRCLPNDEFPKLKKFAVGMTSVFGTTYVCEQTFSRMKYVKSAHQTRLTNEHLKAILLIGCSNAKPNIDDILKAKCQFYKSQ